MSGKELGAGGRSRRRMCAVWLPVSRELISFFEQLKMISQLQLKNALDLKPAKTTFSVFLLDYIEICYLLFIFTCVCVRSHLQMRQQPFLNCPLCSECTAVGGGEEVTRDS